MLVEGIAKILVGKLDGSPDSSTRIGRVSHARSFIKLQFHVKYMNALLKIDSIMFYVSNLEKAAKFYENVLGLKCVWTDKGQGMIGFIFPESDSEIVIHNDSSIPNPRFSFLVEDVQKFCDEYQKKGYTVAREPFDVRCGKFAVLADNDGNELPIVDLTKFGNKPSYDEER